MTDQADWESYRVQYSVHHGCRDEAILGSREGLEDAVNNQHSYSSEGVRIVAVLLKRRRRRTGRRKREGREEEEEEEGEKEERRKRRGRGEGMKGGRGGGGVLKEVVRSSVDIPCTRYA
jgi:hypothetical protein